MAIKKLVEVWDGKNLIKDNIYFLKQNTKEVHLPITARSKIILDDLLDTYKKIPCAGIAANQIGYEKRIFIGLKYDKYDDGEEDEKKESVFIANFILLYKTGLVFKIEKLANQLSMLVGLMSSLNRLIRNL